MSPAFVLSLSTYMIERQKKTQAYTSKRRKLIQVLPVPNAYTKFGDAYIHFANSFCYLLMHVCIFIAIRPQCVYLVYALNV